MTGSKGKKKTAVNDPGKTSLPRSPRQYIAADMKSFYASVECVARGLDPLKANLLVADASRSDKTIVLAVSPALKAVGVPSRPRLFEAKRAISDAERRLRHGIRYIIAPPRMAEYIRVSSDIYAICLKYVAPEDIHVYSIDESFIDATPYLHFYRQDASRSPAHTMAMAIIKDVLKDTGITATVGILYLAKVAMDIVAKHSPADRDGVRIAFLDEDAFKNRLWAHMPLTDFWQTGSGTARRLAKYGMYTMGDVAAMSLHDEELFYREFGINGELVIDHAWGIEPVTMPDIKAYRPDAHSLSTGQVLPRPYAFAEAKLVFLEMADNLSYDMKKKDIVSDRFSFWVSFDPKSLENGTYAGPLSVDSYGRLHPKHVSGHVRLGAATSNSRIITDSLAREFLRKTDPALLVRRIGISAERIQKDSHIFQLDLFTDYGRLEREQHLQDAMLSIRHRYGPNAVLRGSSYMDGSTLRERNLQIGGHRA